MTERTYTAGGESLTAKEWAARQGFKVETWRARVNQRITRQGMTEEEAILTPVMDRYETGKRNSLNSPWRESNKRLFMNPWRKVT